MELKPALQGNQVRVLVEEMDGGNFTCHLSSDGQYLNHTLILIQFDPDNRTVILEEKSPEEGRLRNMEGERMRGNEQREENIRERKNSSRFVVPSDLMKSISLAETWDGCCCITEIRKMVGEADKRLRTVAPRKHDIEKIG